MSERSRRCSEVGQKPKTADQADPSSREEVFASIYEMHFAQPLGTLAFQFMTPVAAMATGEGSARGSTVLVFEDEFLVRWALVDELRCLGHRVVEVENADQALQMLND